MELKINAKEFKVFGADGRKYGVMAFVRDGILTLHRPDLRVEGVPFEATGEATVPEACNIPGDKIKNAGEYIRISTWGKCAENPFQFDVRDGDTVETHTINAENLTASLRWLVEASSHDKGRPNLRGVFAKVKGGIIDLVATDGHRMGIDRMAEKTGCADCEFTLSNYALETALKLAGKRGELGAVTVRTVRNASAKRDSHGYGPQALDIRHSEVTFSGVPGVTFSGAVINLEYPDYRRVIPGTNPEFTFSVEFSELCAFVKDNKRVAASPYHMCFFRVGNDGVRVFVKDGNGEETASDLRGGYATKRDEETYFNIAFNVNYLLDALNGLTGEPGDVVTFHAKGEASACLLVDGDRKVILMPVRI